MWLSKTYCPKGHEYTEENKKYKSTGRFECKQCHRDRERVRAQSNPEKNRAKTLQWQKDNPEKNAEKSWRWFLKHHYHITPEQWVEQFKKQNYCCANPGCSEKANPMQTCLDKRIWHVDHDHKTGAFRGILCWKCNRATGYANDDPERLRGLATYIEQHQSKTKVYFRPLEERLLKLGGTTVISWNGTNLPATVQTLVKSGQEYSIKNLDQAQKNPNRCHDNSLQYALQKPDIYAFVTGYGLSNDGLWRPHSWVLERKTQTILETTEPRIKYFGVQDQEAIDIAINEKEALTKQ